MEKRVLRRPWGPAGSLFVRLDICPHHVFGWHFSEAKGGCSSGFGQLHAGFWLGCPITPPPLPQHPSSPLLLPPCQFLAGLGNKSGTLLLLAAMMPRAESIRFPGNSYFEDVRSSPRGT